MYGEDFQCKYYDENEFRSLGKGTNFSVYSHNIRSLSGKFDELKVFLAGLEFPFSIIALQEVWSINRDFKLEGYELLEYATRDKTLSNRNPNCGGGVGCFIKEGLNYEILHFGQEFERGVYESIWIKLSISGKTRIVGNIYGWRSVLQETVLQPASPPAGHPSTRTVLHQDIPPPGQSSTRTVLHQDGPPPGQSSSRAVLQQGSPPAGQSSTRTVLHQDSPPGPPGDNSPGSRSSTWTTLQGQFSRRTTLQGQSSRETVLQGDCPPEGQSSRGTVLQGDFWLDFFIDEIKTSKM